MWSEKGDGGLFLFQLVTILKSIFFSRGKKKKLTNCSHTCSASFCYGAFIRAANAAEEGERKAVYKQGAVHFDAVPEVRFVTFQVHSLS